MSKQHPIYANAAVEVAISIAVYGGIIATPILGVFIVLLVAPVTASHPHVDFMFTIPLLIGSFFIALITIPFIAPTRLRRWQKANMPIMSNSVMLSFMVSLVFALPGLLASSWAWLINCVAIGSFYGFCIASLYLVSHRLLRKTS